MGPSGQGVYSVCIFVWLIGVAVSGLGIQWTNSVFAGRPGTDLPTLAANSLLFVLLSVGISLTLASVSAITGVGVPAVPRVLFIWLLATMPIGVAVDAVAGVVWGLNRVRQWVVVFGFLAPTVTLLGIAGLVLGHRLTVATALAAWLTGQIVVLIIGILLLRPDRFGRARPNFARFKEMLSYGARADLAHLVGTLNFRLDTVFVIAMLGPRAVGLYSVSVLVSQSLFLVPTALGSSLLPMFSSADEARVTDMMNRALRLTLLVSCLAAVVLAVSSGYLLPLFGSAYREATATFLVLLPGTALYSIMHITTVYWDSSVRKPQVNLYLAGLSAGLDIAGLLVLMPRFGLPGAAIASSGAYIVAMAVSLWLYKRRTGSNLNDMLFFRPKDLRRLLWPAIR